MCNVAGRTAVLAITAASMSAIVTQPAEAAPIKIFPGDISSNAAEVAGVVGDGTLNNDSWHVTTGPVKTVDFFWLSDVSGLVNPGVKIRDIVRVSFDVKHSGAYLDPTFSMQIETLSTNEDGFQAIDFFSNVRDDTSVDDSADFAFRDWNTYEWNQTGDASSGLEGTMHQNESDPGTDNGGNGQNNSWYTLKETLDLDAQYQGDSDATNNDYYSWLDEPINALKITALDVGGEFDGWIDNFTFTYETGNGEQTTVVDFAAESVSVPEPATLGMALLGIALLGMGLGTRRYRS